MTERRAFLVSIGMAFITFWLALLVCVVGMYLWLASGGVHQNVLVDLFDASPSTPDTAAWVEVSLLGLVCVVASAWFAWTIFSTGFAVLRPLKLKSKHDL